MKLKQPKTKFENVMLIDDSELDNFINEKTIESDRFAKRTYVHTSAKSALEFLSNLKAMGESHESVFPEVIFIDINMPMINGFQFIEQYLKNFAGFFKETRLVILTSSVYREDQEKAALLSKQIAFMHKPLTSETLGKLFK